MEEVFPPYYVFINHRGPDVKRTLASLIYHRLESHGLKVFLDQRGLQLGDSLIPAIKSVICTASVQIAIFSKTYAESTWCLKELLWMFDSNSNKGRFTIQQLDSWISALNKVSSISGVVISTEQDDLGERLEEIAEVVLKEVRREELDVGLGRSGKSTLVAHLYNSKRSQFKRCCFLSQDTRRGRSVLRKRLRGLRGVLIVFDDINSSEQIDNLLFVKDVVGYGSLILVTSRDQSLLDGLEWTSGFPLSLKVLAGKLHNERDPRKWKQQLESLREQLPNNLLEQMVNDSYKSLHIVEKEAFLDIAHFLIGEDAGMVERVLDGLNGSGSQCLQALRHKCLVEFESADIILPTTVHGEFVSWRIGVKGSFKIRMHDLVRDLAIQIGIKEAPLRLCCRNNTMISPRCIDYGLWTQQILASGLDTLQLQLKIVELEEILLTCSSNSCVNIHAFQVIQETKEAATYREEPLPVHNILEEPTDITDDSHSEDEEQDTFMDEATLQINEAGVDEFIKDFYTSFEEVIDSSLAQLVRKPIFSIVDTSILATLMLLLNLKVTHGLTNTCFTDILRLLANKILPKDNNQPQSFEGEKLEGQGTSKRIKDAKEWEALHLKWPERCSWNWLKTNIEHEATKGRNGVTRQQLNFVKGSINGEVTYYKGMWNFGHHFCIKKDEDHDVFIEVFEGHEKPHEHQVHEDDEFIDFNLPVVEDDEDHENASINLFVDLGPINDEVFMPSNEEISSEDDIV
ncbi:hypothetical protein SUGI_0468760 [Cryptomeria japonica]|nr:hypothetical protein SUGI_0468760 [Cryptomeria japonica]